MLPAPGLALPADDQEKELVDDEKRQQVAEELARKGGDGNEAEIEIEHRRDQVDRRKDAGEIAPHRRQVHQLLPGGETAHEERILAQEDLNRALRPAETLLERAWEIFRGQALDQNFIVVDRAPAHRVQAHRGRHVLGHGNRRERLHGDRLPVAVEVE